MANDWKAIRNALLITGVNKAATRLTTEYKTRRIWMVTISAEDELFNDACEWLLSQENSTQSPRRNLAVKTKRYYDADDVGRSKLLVGFDDAATNKIMVGEHEVSVRVDDPSNPITGDMDIRKAMKPPKLILTAKSRVGRDAVLAALRQLHEDKQKKDRKPSLKMLGKWNDWTTRGDLPTRSMESVVVKGNVVDSLLADLAEFRSREAEYNHRGIPYHRAYLLTGPPGTGKTSAVKAVAGALGMDLWYAPLSEMGKDGKIVDTLSSVSPGSILLLEDIDSFHAATTRNTGKDELSNSGLLNALDGVATPHGLVTIMTTNHPENLDHALMRPGRIDRVFSFENPDSDTIHRHFAFFYGKPAQFKGRWPGGLSSAAVSEIFKRYMDNPIAAEAELLSQKK